MTNIGVGWLMCSLVSITNGEERRRTEMMSSPCALPVKDGSTLCGCGVHALNQLYCSQGLEGSRSKTKNARSLEGTRIRCR